MSGLFSMVEETKYGGDGITRRWVVNMGAEGYADNFHAINHWSLYTFGNVERRPNGSLALNNQAAGVLGWSNSYALNQFYDPVGERRIIWGWSDEDINNYGVKARVFKDHLVCLGRPSC
jgi:beta-fructofuranosidase